MEIYCDVVGEKNGIEEMNGLKYENRGDNKSDCYFVDLENICNGGVNLLQHSSTTTNSTITEINCDIVGEKNGIEEMNGLKYENRGDNKSDCYIVDLENICNGGVNLLQHSSTTTNSRITLQRSLSRKVPQRGIEKKVLDRDTTSLAPSSSSPRDAQVVSTPMKPISPPTMPLGSQDHTMTSHQHHHSVPQHQITIKTGGINTISDGRLGRRSSLKRSSYTWFSDPKRILLFFASLSSMGTMLLIYFTLAVSKANDKDNVLDWQ